MQGHALSARVWHILLCVSMNHAYLVQPSSVKSLKMAILPKLATPTNGREVVAELSEYVGGVDAELARQAVRAIADIAVRVPLACETVLESLVEALEVDAEYVRAETVIVMQDILRKYPDRAIAVIPSLHRCLKRMEDPNGRAAVIWMFGEYGHLIEDAPYLLEPIIDNIKDEESVSVRNALLTATLKLFFKRPPEVQKMMGRLFKACLADGTPASVHDRALLYFRLLRSNVREAAAVIGGEHPPVLEFHDEQGTEVKDKIFREFNSLSVLYGKPSDSFISADHLITPLDAPGGKGGVKTVSTSDGDTLLGSGGEELPPTPSHASTAPTPTSSVTSAPAPPVREIDLLGEDLLGMGSAYTSSPPAPTAPSFALKHGVLLDPAAFQAKWGSLPSAPLVMLQAVRVPSTVEVETLARAGAFYTIASGDVGSQLKFYFYGGDMAGALHLFEVALDKTNGHISVALKSENMAVAQQVVQALATAIHPVLSS